jgi:hypothetical protein
MCWLASVAEYSFTGIATNPNEIVKLPIDRAAMDVSPPFGHCKSQRSKFMVIIRLSCLIGVDPGDGWPALRSYRPLTFDF